VVVPGAVLAAQPACGDTLTANTTLTADLDCSAYAGTALTLGKNSIKLNLGGHTLTGYAGDDSYVAVYTTHKYTTITNGTITDAGYGIETDGAVGTTISSLTINGEAASAFTDDFGIYIDAGASNAISHVTIDGPYYGIYLYESASNQISYSTLTADYIAEYAEYDGRDTISHTTTTAPDGFYTDYSGGEVYQSDTANGGEYGFYMDCDTYGPVTLTGNTANGNSEYGIYTYYCYVDPPNPPEPSLIKGNTTNSNVYGLVDEYSIGATVTKNTAKHNVDGGFYLEYPAALQITKNLSEHNSGVGIELEDAYGSYYAPKVISGNIVKFNTTYGIYADQGVVNGVCHGNSVKHNTSGNYSGLVCS